MAMEIIRTTTSGKQLHKHAVPVILFSAGLLLVTLLIYNNAPVIGLSRALVTPLVKIKPAGVGLAHISVNHDPSARVSKLDSGTFNQTGHSVNLSLSIQSN